MCYHKEAPSCSRVWVQVSRCSRLSVQGGYMVLTVVALDYLHDAWFYWTHRLLHWKPLYRHVHYLHHRYATPARLWIPQGRQTARGASHMIACSSYVHQLLW
jgi:hypothetical protein